MSLFLKISGIPIEVIWGLERENEFKGKLRIKSIKKVNLDSNNLKSITNTNKYEAYIEIKRELILKNQLQYIEKWINFLSKKYNIKNYSKEGIKLDIQITKNKF